MRIRMVLIGGFAVMALAAAACSSETDAPRVASLGEGDVAASSSIAPEADPEDALLDWAECMREEGVDVPDPQVIEGGNGGGQVVGFDGPAMAMNDPDVQAAFEACQDRMPNGGDLELDPEQEAAMADAQLAFAECMKERGIEIEEPTGGQGFAIEIGANDPDLKEALEACQPIFDDVMPAPEAGN